jgi:hypothetical protein
MNARRQTPATRSSHSEEETISMFATGFSPVKEGAIPQIPSEQWESEIEQMHAEERDWWAGDLITAKLAVELPFWLMVPDGEISLTYDKTTVTAAIHGRYLEVSDGPMSLASRSNAVIIGPGDEVWKRDLSKSVVPSEMPVYRPMKTVVSFQVDVLADCFEAWRTRGEIARDDRTGIRRINRVIKYFRTLAIAHIPFLNQLITSYRSTSLDPYAVEVSDWDVPFWYASHEGTLARIGLMPYWDHDALPSLNSGGETEPFVATSLEEVQSQAKTEVAAGKLELLDAYSLMFRGRFGDAVRSAVTSIEVAVETQLAKLLKEKGHSEEQIAERLEETRNSFFDRIQDYEQLSQKRLPGPLIHEVPYINGIRLRSELDWVRNLRHKVVHEGIRVNIFERGKALRAIETMSWLFEWLSWEDEYGPENSRNYIYFTTLRGQPDYTLDYTENGVRISPIALPNPDEPIITADQIILRQYLDTTDITTSDVDLFARMTFEYLCINCEEGPPEPLEEPRLRERYLINDGSRTAIVFCLEFDHLIDLAMAEAVLDRVRDFHKSNGESKVLVIIHHQHQYEKLHRETTAAVSQDVQKRLKSCNATVVTAMDLQLLVQGVLSCGWPVEPVRDLLFTPGRQAEYLTGHELVGKCDKFYPDHSAVSIELIEGQSITLGARIVIRLCDRYHEEEVKSMQINGEDVAIAAGPCRVGIVSSLTKSDVKRGQTVFSRKV